MNNIKGIEYDFEKLSPLWRFCFCEGCPRHADCLRYLTGQQVPASTTCGHAVFPTAYRNGDCPHFKEVRVIRAAYGFKPLFRDVKKRDYSVLISKMKAFLGGHGTYYRYNRGERMLTPEQQQWILGLFTSYGYTENLAFEHYCDLLDFS